MITEKHSSKFARIGSVFLNFRRNNLLRLATWSASSIGSTARKLKLLCSDNSANIAITFAIALLPLMEFVGCAVDYSMAARQRTKLQNALDAAILAGSVAGKASLDAGSGNGAAINAATTAATAFFQGNYTNFSAGRSSITPVYNVNGLVMTGTATSSDIVANTFMKIVGFPTTTLNVSAGTQATAQTYLNVYLLVDISSSMLLPATTAGINQMISGTGCALACHDNASNNDSYGYAINNNIQLRYQVVNQGVQNLLTYLSSNSLFSSHVKVGLWSFDNQITQMSALTYNYTSVSNNFPAPAIAINNAASATPFNNIIAGFVSIVGSAGDGSSPASPRKMVIIATDGVNDPTRDWTWDTSQRPQVRVFDTTFCNTLQANGVTVTIINTPYFPMPWDWGYNATLGQPGNLGGATRVDDIPIALSACAGRNFVSASTVQSIQASFVNLFTMAAPMRMTN